MTRLDDFKGLLSVRSINSLKRLGYNYLEKITPDAVRRVTGKKTKREILEFIEAWNSMDDNEKIFAMKQADIQYDVKMYKVFEGEYISDNGNWSVTSNGIYFNYEDASYPVGDMEDVPKTVEEIFNKLKEVE